MSANILRLGLGSLAGVGGVRGLFMEQGLT